MGAHLTFPADWIEEENNRWAGISTHRVIWHSSQNLIQGTIWIWGPRWWRKDPADAFVITQKSSVPSPDWDCLFHDLYNSWPCLDQFPARRKVSNTFEQISRTLAAMGISFCLHVLCCCCCWVDVGCVEWLSQLLRRRRRVSDGQFGSCLYRKEKSYIEKIVSCWTIELGEVRHKDQP